MSNDPAAADNNRHHTESYRSKEDHLSQFAPDLTSEPHLIMSEAELKHLNDKLGESMKKPIDWDKETPF